MERCYNCKKEAIALICSTCEVGVCMWCFSYHFNHQLKNVKDYLNELLATKKNDIAKHFQYATKANNLKVCLETPNYRLNEPERVQKQCTELAHYITEVAAVSEYLEQLAHTLAATTIEHPMTFMEKIKSIKIEIRIPEYLNEFKEVKIMCEEEEKYSFKYHIESKIEDLISEIGRRTKLAFLELESYINTGKKLNLSEMVENLEVFFTRQKEEFINTIDYELINPQYPNVISNDFKENKKVRKKMENNQKRIADEIKAAENKIVAMNNLQLQLKKEIEGIQNYKALQLKEIKASENARSELQNENKKIMEANSDLKKKLQRLADEILNAESNYNSMQTKYSNITEKINKENKKFEILVQETKILEEKYNEAKAIQEYKRITTQKIVILTESLRKALDRNSKLRDGLKEVKTRLVDIEVSVKKLISLFHRERNKLQKAVQQAIRDVQMVYIKRIDLSTNHNKDYRERTKLLLRQVKITIKSVKESFKECTILQRTSGIQLLDCIKPLHTFLNDTAVFSKALRELFRVPLGEIETIKIPKVNKILKNVYKEIGQNAKELKSASCNTNKQITELECRKEVTKKKVESLLRSNEEGWDLCDIKETSIKEEIIEVIKSYLQIK